MDQTKAWYASTAIWGGVIAVVAPAVAAIFHVTVSTQDTAQLADALGGLGTAIGGIIAIFGRVKATKKIGTAP